MADDYPEIAARFARDIAQHRMTVLQDDGHYRHLRFMQPPSGSSCYWFDLITVPGALIFQGDGETFAFRRTEDMFQFFRSGIWRDGSHHIHPSYWSEKLTIDRDSVMTYSEELFKGQVAEELKIAEEFYPGVTAAWQEKAEGFLAEYNTEHEETAREALRDFEYLEVDQTGEAFSFSDTWEWEFRDYDWWYLWACHAIVWGIARYDRVRRYGLQQLAAPAPKTVTA